MRLDEIINIRTNFYSDGVRMYPLSIYTSIKCVDGVYEFFLLTVHVDSKHWLYDTLSN